MALTTSSSNCALVMLRVTVFTSRHDQVHAHGWAKYSVRRQTDGARVISTLVLQKSSRSEIRPILTNGAKPPHYALPRGYIVDLSQRHVSMCISLVDKVECRGMAKNRYTLGLSVHRRAQLERPARAALHGGGHTAHRYLTIVPPPCRRERQPLVSH